MTSIAVQFAQSVPAVRQHISDVVAERSDIVNQSLRDQWQQLVCRPLSKLHETETEPKTYAMVVDALDECNNERDIRIIVQLLAEVRSLAGVRLRVLLTSRPEVPIRHEFGQVADTEHKEVVLHNISPSIVDRDIRRFLECHLRIIAKECYQADDWPGAEVVSRLVQSASGLFIWAATACLFIREGLFPDERLHILVMGSASGDAAGPEEQLNKIYVTVLQTSVRPEYSAHERGMYYSMLKLILGSIAVLASPLSVISLGALLRVPEQKTDQMLKDLHAILNIPKNRTQPLRLHHPSFRDFILSKDRCGDDNLWVNERGAHERLASCCLQLMSESLRRDICRLSKPGTLRSEVKEETVTSRLPPELRYACRYWVEHLERSQHNITDGDATHVFLQTHLLHWFEAMSIIGKMSECESLLNRLEALATVRGHAWSMQLIPTDLQRRLMHVNA